MRIAYLASRYLDPDNPRSWSGLPYFIRRALEAADVETIVLPLEETGHALRWARFLGWRLLGRRYLRLCEPGVLRGYARQIERRLGSLAVDAVFSPSTWLFAYLETIHPIVVWTDACFAGLVDFYPSFTRVAGPSLRAGHEAEQGALDRCTRALYCSEWAAETARARYRVDPGKLEIVPFGGNLQELPTAEEVAAAVFARDPSRCELLFVGVEWERKGGDIAVEALEALRSSGWDARLTVVGCRPPWWRRPPPGVELVPFIGKETARGRRQLDDLYRRSHFFILPSRAEAFGLVLSEANAFGVPCLTTAVGGLPSVIRDDVNGRLFGAAERGRAYADYAASVLREPGRYHAMALAARQEAATRLSWGVAGRRVAGILEEIARKNQLESLPA